MWAEPAFADLFADASGGAAQCGAVRGLGALRSALALVLGGLELLIEELRGGGGASGGGGGASGGGGGGSCGGCSVAGGSGGSSVTAASTALVALDHRTRPRASG